MFDVPLNLLNWGIGDRPINGPPNSTVIGMQKFLSDGGVLPPIFVWVEKNGFHLSEGHHRTCAYLNTCKQMIPAKVYKNQKDAETAYGLER